MTFDIFKTDKYGVDYQFKINNHDDGVYALSVIDPEFGMPTYLGTYIDLNAAEARIAAYMSDYAYM